MTDAWQNILLEIGLFIFLGILYYFYQKRKIVKYEENKTPIVMGLIMQSCLSDKNETPQPELDSLIESLDDYLHNRSAHPPIALLKVFMNSNACSKELHDVIREGLLEIEDGHQKK